MSPPIFTITPDMLCLIAEMDEFKGQWRMMRSLLPEKLSGVRKAASTFRQLSASASPTIPLPAAADLP
jgi:hypothetical protein